MNYWVTLVKHGDKEEEGEKDRERGRIRGEGLGRMEGERGGWGSKDDN